jgi:HEPN domain-containing protein
MKLLGEEWVQKADDDLIAAQKLFRSRTRPLYDVVCFHCQQCAEKYLKAFLQEKETPVPKIHNLTELLDLCKKLDPSLELLRADLKLIDQYSVQVRYPGMNAEKNEAKAALKAAQTVKAFLRQRLELG